jgi:mannose-6-phosphate isomerase-like protein (cupin superfamily)
VRSFSEVSLPSGELANEAILMSESATFVRSYVPAGLAGRSSHTHSVEQLYFILQGELQVDIGSSTVTAHTHDLVILPRETAHQNYNDSVEDELHLEIFVPSPPPWPSWVRDATQEGDLAPPDSVRAEASGRQLAYDDNPGYRSSILADRASGFPSGHVRIDRLEPGSSGPGLHIHRFDQYYFLLEGELCTEIAGESFSVSRHELAILPAGVPHRQWNDSDAPAKWLTLNLPEPEPGVRWDAPVESFTGDFSYRPRAVEPI